MSEQHTHCTRGYVLRTDMNRYLCDNGAVEWGPQYSATSLQYATLYDEDFTEWELRRIKNIWGTTLTPVKVNVIKIITLEE